MQIMMPRTLNVEKLEKKFSSLTRSRESIQGLSSWIMHHKEFCKEIVQVWLSGLTKDFNTLTMFYVANDVIQNCGRKKAPEFREAFSSALEKAVCLEKVREIKSDVNRLLTIWNEREIYDNEFFKKLENRLNGIDDEQSSEPEELSESEIISNFKVNNLIDCLKNLKKLEDLLQEKEVILKDLEEPAMPNLENLIVKMESQSEIKKLDEYYDYVEEYISLTSSVEEARKALLKELKYSIVYYSVQNEDVKKVAHAYRIYGKKLKNMEKIVLEKKSDLEKTFLSPVCNDSLDNQAADMHVSQKSPCEVSSQEQENVSVGDKMYESHESTEESKQKTEKRTDSPEKISSIKTTEETCHDEEKNICVTTQNSENLAEIDTSKCENSDIYLEESVAENSTRMKGTTDSVHGYSNEVDFLLEEAYDNRRIKTKSNFKRKLENLLNAKGKKTCHISPQSDKSIEHIPNDALGSSPMDSLDSASLIARNLESEVNSETAQKFVTTTEKSNEASETALELVTATEKNSEASKNSSDEHLESTIKTIDSNKSVCSDDVNENDDQSMQTKGKKQGIPSLLETLSEVIKTGKTVNTPYNKLPEIPTELLKNILHKNKINMTHHTLDNLDNECSSRVPNNLTTSIELSDANLPKLVNVTEETKDVINSNEVTNSNISENKSCSSNDYLKAPCLGDEIQPADSDKNFTGGSSASTHFVENQIKEGTSACENKTSGASEEENSLAEENPSLIETLQNVLKFISENEAARNQEVKDHISRNPPTLIPLENTLKLYQYIMQYYEQTSDEQKRLANELIPNELTKTDVLSIKNNSVPEHSTQGKIAYESHCINMPICSSKEDNLEIMDMEVDSSEENMDS